jgi:hypothetical protein
MINRPPTIAEGVSSFFIGSGRSSSTIATMKMVSSAATEDSTGEVRLIRTRNEPEKTAKLLVQVDKKRYASELACIGQDADGKHFGCLASGELESFQSGKVQDRKRNPEYTESE